MIRGTPDAYLIARDHGLANGISKSHSFSRRVGAPLLFGSTLLATAACSEAPRAAAPDTMGGTGSAATHTSEDPSGPNTSRPTTGGSETGSSSGEHNDEGPKLDVSIPDTGEDPSSTGCTAVDILMVIDNSGSMCSYQSNLAQTLPDFADAIFAALPPDTSIHLGITTTSFSSGGTHQEENCSSVQGAAEIADAYIPPADGMVQGNGYQGRLLEYEGQRYFEANTGDPSSRLPMMEWFSNAAFSVNCNGGAFEFPTAAAAYALDPVNAATNDGFLRDEGAVLAMFVLSDEVDQSPEGLEAYRDTVLAAKSACGGADCISTAGLLSDGCVPSEPLVWQFLNAFGGAPAWGDIADPSVYASVVNDALTEVITQTCDLIPAG
ncbi:MAG: hypothetical protein ACRBN8_32475 [Nannocystales bacterium]